MSTSTDGIICYGIKFDEDFGFPWTDDNRYSDIEEWWMRMRSFTPSIEVYDEEGEYINGIEPSCDVLDTYFTEQREWWKAHPLPVELVNYCSGEYPIYIVAVPGTIIKARRGYPVALDISKVFDLDVDKVAALASFCQEFDIKYEGKPQWYLASYWG